jgi:hypothetical protein
MVILKILKRINIDPRFAVCSKCDQWAIDCNCEEFGE